MRFSNRGDFRSLSLLWRSKKRYEFNFSSSQIPVMRLVMSKKQTRRPTHKLLKEGWIVHYTDKNDMRKKHYWRLDTKAIVMYQDETSNRYYKEVPLGDILSIRSLLVKPEHGPVTRYVHNSLYALYNTWWYQPCQSHTVSEIFRTAPHWFELKTISVTYYVGVSDDAQADVGAQWEAAIRQAWMPVTPQSSTGSGAGQLRGIYLRRDAIQSD